METVAQFLLWIFFWSLAIHLIGKAREDHSRDHDL